MIKLKENKPFKYNGAYYDLTAYTPERLQLVYDTNPELRHKFEEIEETIKIGDSNLNAEQFDNVIKQVVKQAVVKRSKKK